MNAEAFASAAGGAMRAPGGFLCRCPVPSHGQGKGDRSPSLFVADGEQSVIFTCFAGCDRKDVFREALSRGWIACDEDDQQRPVKPRPAPILSNAEEDAERTAAALAIWREGRTAVGTPVQHYLQHRGITDPPPPSLRYHPSVKYTPSGLWLPCMVAAVQGPDRRIQAIQRTFIRMDGKGKAGVRVPKMSLGPIRGGAVRLAAAGATLCLAEGIESALSLQQMTGKPTWAVLGNCWHSFVPPPEVRTVVVAGDGDEAAERHLKRAADRFREAGLQVLNLRPPAGQDWNDAVGAFEERAGILEYDGGADRAEAELAAFAEIIGGTVNHA